MNQNQDNRPSYDDLLRRLKAAESALAAVRKGEIDAIVGDGPPLVVRLADAETREAHFKRVLMAIRNVNRLIVQEPDPARLIAGACDHLTQSMGYHNAWIALMDPDTGRVFHTADAGFNGGFAEFEHDLLAGNLPAMVCRVMETPGVMVVRDPVSECPDCPLALAYEDRAGMCARLVFNDNRYGILSVSVPPAFADEDEEQSLFRELADDLAIALHRIAAESALEQARENTRLSEEKFARVFAAIPDAVVISRASDGEIREANDAFVRLSGYSKEMVKGRTSGDVGFWVIPGAREEYVARLFRDGWVHNFETDYQTRDGNVLHMLIPGTIIDTGDTDDSRLILSIVRDITAYRRQLAQNALLGRMLDDAPAAITVHDTHGRFLFANRRTFAMHGYTQDEFMAVNLHDLDVPEAAALLEERFEKISRTGEASFESAHFRKDGTAFPLHVLARSIDWEGQPAVLSIAADISIQKQAEQALRESERFLRQIIDTSPACIFVKDRESRYVLVNKAIADLYGVLPEAMIGKTDLELAQNNCLGLAEAEQFSADDREVLEKNTEKRIDEEAFMASGGGKKWFQTVKTALVSDFMKDCMLGVATDITQRKQANEALRESEEKFRYIFDHSVVPKALTFPSGEFEPNAAFCEMVGYTREELAATTWQNITHPEDIDANQAEVESILSGQKTSVRFIKRYLHKNGDVVWAHMGTSLRRDAAGNPMYLITTAVNISEQKQAELEREKLQDQLIQAQKMESVGRLAGGVAHDFNNMLAVILGYTELALDKIPENEPLREDLDEVMQAAQRSTDIARQLLAFARRQTISPKVLDLNETVEEMLKMLRRLIGEDIDLSWQPGGGLWPVNMDPSQVDQIMANLCVNARDAIDGVGKITIETENVTLDADECAHRDELIPGDYVLLMVSDTGRGMDPATRERIFEPFFTTKGMGEGTGLGLSTIYGIVKQNKGDVQVYSEPGNGTTFRIYLPRHVGEAYVAEDQGVPQILLGRGETVLVAEDEDAILKLTARMLQGLGYTVLTALSPTHAEQLAKAQTGPIDLLITDVVMPEMSGRDLADRLRNFYPDLKVLYMSGYTADVIAHRGVLEENMQFISKPFSQRDLARKVREALE